MRIYQKRKNKQEQRNEKNHLSEKSIPAQKQPIQSRSVHFLDIKLLWEADSIPPLLFQVISHKIFSLQKPIKQLQTSKPNQKLNQTNTHFKSQFKQLSRPNFRSKETKKKKKSWKLLTELKAYPFINKQMVNLFALLLSISLSTFTKDFRG